ncbi:MAG TPA: serine hydrolase [Lachnospiraceae bacterium]|nr:serine hydrolase [Lachnospiraceae bacterium]
MKKQAKKLISILLILILSFLPARGVLAETSPVSVSAYAYVVMDANSGEILYSEHRSNRIYPASTAKLMTAIVALENGKLTDRIIAKQSALKYVPNDAYEVGLKANKTYTFNQLLNLTLVVSAADAANTIAAGTGGTLKNFIAKMNAKAKELGLEHTSFDNTIGLDIGNGYKKTYSTATDLAVLARYAMSIKEIRDVVAKETYTFRGKVLDSTNQFYSTASYSDDRYTIIGTKTGTTKAAGSVLIATARDDEGHEVICAFFGNVNRTSTYQDIRELLDYTFDRYDEGSISLSKGFYDVRFRDSESTIVRLCDEGLLAMNSTGEFKPTAKVTQSYFLKTVNRICNTDLLATDASKRLTIEDLADILYESYPVEVSEERLDAMDDTFNSKNALTQEEIEELVALYDSGVLPNDYNYNVSSYITKEDTVMIADSLSGYIENYVAIKDNEDMVGR